MEERDYLLREIEKMGKIFSAIRQMFFGGNGNLAITIENQIEESKSMLLYEANFNLDKFLYLNLEKSIDYICSFKGFNVENIELLAETLAQIGFHDNCNDSKLYLEKGLLLYEFCNLKSQTFSFERDAKIKAIKSKQKI
jgi:hypothetical protein